MVDGVLENRGSRYPGGGGPKPVGCTGIPVLVAAFSSCRLTVRGVTLTNCSPARRPLTCTRAAFDVPWVGVPSPACHAHGCAPVADTGRSAHGAAAPVSCP